MTLITLNTLIGGIVEDYNKTGEIKNNVAILNDIVMSLKSKGVDKFLTACTEISELLNDSPNNEFISTLDIMVDELYNRVIQKK
jgi:aspartate/glutamate racemase